MFPKKKRLTKKAFNRFFASGKRHHTPAFQLIYNRETDADEPFQVAASVSKKVYKSAVARNRLRRQMYHALQAGPLLRGAYIVIAKPAAKDLSYLEVEGAIRKLVSQTA